MKRLVVVTLCLFSLSVFADHHEEGTFEERKAMMLSKVESRMARLQENKNCISSASNKDALKACQTKMREEGKKMKEAWKEKKEEWKGKMKEMRKEKKK